MITNPEVIKAPVARRAIAGLIGMTSIIGLSGCDDSVIEHPRTRESQPSTTEALTPDELRERYLSTDREDTTDSQVTQEEIDAKHLESCNKTREAFRLAQNCTLADLDDTNDSGRPDWLDRIYRHMSALDMAYSTISDYQKSYLNSMLTGTDSDGDGLPDYMDPEPDRYNYGPHNDWSR